MALKANRFADFFAPPISKEEPAPKPELPPKNVPQKTSKAKSNKSTSNEILIQDIQNRTNPMFTGGREALNQYISNNISFRNINTKKDISGTVYVAFEVSKMGEIQNAKVIKGIGDGFDKEALRVIKMMPHWQPGTLNGKAVRTKMSLPIHFSYQ